MLPDDVVARIDMFRRAGAGYRAIASHLNLEGTPTAHGGARWYPATVRALVRSRGLYSSENWKKVIELREMCRRFGV